MKFTAKQKKQAAIAMLEAMDTLGDNPRYPDGIQYDLETGEIDTYKLVYDHSEDCISLNECNDWTVGEGWKRWRGSYITGPNIKAMIFCLREWDKFADWETLIEETETK